MFYLIYSARVNPSLQTGFGDGFKEKPIVLGFHGCKCDVCALALQGTILQFESSDNCK